MTTTTHGGPRPKTREDDARGGARVGAGPKPKSFTLKLGDAFYTTTRSAEGRAVGMGELWTVAEITRTHVIMQSDTGDTIKLLR